MVVTTLYVHPGMFQLTKAVTVQFWMGQVLVWTAPYCRFALASTLNLAHRRPFLNGDSGSLPSYL